MLLAVGRQPASPPFLPLRPSVVQACLGLRPSRVCPVVYIPALRADAPRRGSELTGRAVPRGR
eukprot:2288329-Pyramimonas_sp.AAC.1